MKTDAQATTSLPGRPRSFETDKVLDAAVDLFWKHGYRATTTRDLATVLGLTQSSIYNAFGSKQGLLTATLERYEAIATEQLVRPLEDSAEGVAAIELFFSNLGGWVTGEGRHGCMLINMMAEDGGTTDALTQRARTYRWRVRDALHLALTRAAEQGEIVGASCESRADLLLGLVLGFNIAARGGASVRELARLMSAVQRQLADWRAES